VPVDSWDLTPPPPSELEDREVPRVGHHLEGKRIALMVTGGIAAMKAPFIIRALRRQGAQVVAFASEEAFRYVTEDVLEWSSVHRVIRRLSAAAEHLSDAAPFDVYLVAPATYNTLNKLRCGIADGVITSSLASALGRMEQGRTRVLVAPTMHGSLHTAILTESLRTLASLGVRIIPPREDYGKHNIPSEEVIVAEVCRAVSTSPLRGLPLLVTGGSIPVPVDGDDPISFPAPNDLGVRVVEELYLRGAEVELIQGGGAAPPPAPLPHTPVGTFGEYRDRVLGALAERGHRAAVFTARIPAAATLARLGLAPLPDLLGEIRQRFGDRVVIAEADGRELPGTEGASARSLADRLERALAGPGGRPVREGI